MSKPHEEEWTTGEGALSGALYENGIWIGSFTKPERARLAKEAPKLAQALLMLGFSDPDNSEWHTVECWDEKSSECTRGCVAAMSALRSIGVMP